MVEAVVEYDYLAENSNELTIKKGDVIREIIKKSDGWWEGTLRDKRGMFPDNFVTLIQKENKVIMRNKSHSRPVRQCEALFSYHPAHDDELSLSVGDIIEIISEVEEGWWKGRLGESEGVFPSNFVAEIKPSQYSKSKTSNRDNVNNLAGENDLLPAPNLPPKPSKIICQVKFAYDACNDDELTLREGDLITLISKDGQDLGWWRGELNGKIGVFPDNFVVVIPNPDSMTSSSVHAHERKQEKTASSKMTTSVTDAPKPNQSIAAHRKSLDLPPVPGKKPDVPKKSPTAVGNFAAFKPKITSDKIDGASSSRLATPSLKLDEKSNDFDQVGRSAMLPDVRANRVKKPGRRPPSTVYKDSEGLQNGNSDHSSQPTTETSNDDDEEEEKKSKGKKEWEIHRAPWVEELKQNQAKRTSVTTGVHKKSASPTSDKVLLDNDDDLHISKSKSPLGQHTEANESSPVDMTRSLSALTSSKLITSVNDTSVELRKKSPSLISPGRPQSVHSATGTSPLESLKLSPVAPTTKPPIADKVSVEIGKVMSETPRSSTKTTVDSSKLESTRLAIDNRKATETVSMKQYMELVDRLTSIESRMQQKFLEMQTAIEELQGKLQVEVDLRRLFQAELEKVAQCVTQV